MFRHLVDHGVIAMLIAGYYLVELRGVEAQLAAPPRVRAHQFPVETPDQDAEGFAGAPAQVARGVCSGLVKVEDRKSTRLNSSH